MTALRDQDARAGWRLWLAVVLASGFGALLGVSIAFPVASAINDPSYILSALVFGALIGAGPGAIPGATLIWLLRNPTSGPIAAAGQAAP